METWNLLISKRMRPKRLSFNKLIMVGAEGFEASFPCGHHAVFFVDFSSEASLYQGLAGIL